ncbi:hypothetical protein LguiA_014887 [Lonicera macranthoides]
MANPTRPEFDFLDSEGLEYHQWVSDVETAFVAKEYSATLTDPKDPTDNGPSDKDALKGRFGNIHDTLLPELTVQWNEIRLLDYKRVNYFNKDMLRLKARLNFCGKDLTEDDMTQKTLFTFPTSALILANQYQLEPVGTKKVPEVNYGKMNSGNNPNAKGVGRADPYPRGNKAQRGKGHGSHGAGRGGSSKVWRRNDTIGPSGQENKNCHASAKVAASYKRYRESKEQESHFMNEEDNDAYVNFTIANISGKKDFCSVNGCTRF